MIQSLPSHLPCSDLSIIEPWRLHLDQYTSKVIDIYLRTNLNFLIFILMPPSNSTWHLLLHLEHSSLERTTSALILFVVTKLIYSDTNCCVHKPGYHTYYDTNSWEIRRSPPTTSSTPWDRLPRAHKMNIKRYKKKNTQFNVVRPKLGLCPRGEHFISKLDTKDLTFLMTQEYSPFPWIYA